MILRCLSDESAVASAAARRIVEAAARTIAERGVFRIALAGGSTPKLAYDRLSESRDVDWANVEIFFGDERCVPPEQENSNFKMATDALLSRVGIPPTRVHRIFAELGPDEGARRYELELGSEPLDLVLLGMGADGHTASLFPGGVSDDEPHRVAPAMGPPPQVERVTVTLRALREARTILFLVTGASKANRLAEVVGQVQSNKPTLPAAKASARGAEWIVDRAAAAHLPQTAFFDDDVTTRNG